jgi:hypothetical protein
LVYKIKRDKHGEIAKLKARLVARGDLQMPWEYNETFSPTAKFSAIRTMISMAVQDRLDLHHFNIQGAFLTSDIDRNLHGTTTWVLPP